VPCKPYPKQHLAGEHLAMLARQKSPWWQRALQQCKDKIDDRTRQNPAYGSVMQKGKQQNKKSTQKGGFFVEE